MRFIIAKCGLSAGAAARLGGRLPAAAVALMIAGNLEAQVTFETIALSGTTAPETGGAVYQTFEHVQMNVPGDVVFAARLAHGAAGVDSANDHGIWRVRSGQSPEKVARTNDVTSPFDTWGWDINQNPLVAGDTPVRFRALGRPVLGDDGNVAYASGLVVNDDTVYSWQDGAVWVTGDSSIARPGEGTSVQCWMAARAGVAAYFTCNSGGNQVTQADGFSYGFLSFDSPNVGSDGTVTFTGTVNNWREVSPGEWREFRLRGMWFYPRPQPGGSFNPQRDMSNPRFVVVENLEGPGIPGSAFEEIAGGHSASGLTAQFLAAMREGEGGVTAETRDGIWRTASGTTTALARAGSPAPGTGGMFYEFGDPRLNPSMQAGFRASLLSSASPSIPPSKREGIFLHRFGKIEPAALEGSAAPGFGAGAVFDFFYDPALNGEGIAAFLAYVRGASVDASPQCGIWCGGSPETLHLVARSGDEAAGADGGFFRSFSAPRLNQVGQVAFTATLVPGDGGVAEGDDYGCWAMNQNGELLPVLREGDVVEVSPGDSRTVASLRISDFTDRGEMAMQVGFTDGTEAVIKMTIPVPDVEAYATWAQNHIPDPALRAATADPDRDNTSNLLEFAFGRDPMVADGESGPRVALLHLGEPGAESMELTFERRIDESGMRFEVQVSGDLATWIPVTELISARLVGNGMKEFTVRQPDALAGSGGCFFRVVAIEN